MTGPDLIVVTVRASLTDSNGRLLRLIRWLQLTEVSVELLVLDHAPDLDAFSSVVTTTVLQPLPGLVAEVLNTVGGGRINQALRGRRLRAWLAARPSAAVLLDDPAAASVIRYSDHPRRFVATMPPNLRSDEMTEADRRTLVDAVGWLVNDSAQVSQVRNIFDRPAIEMGALPFPDDLPATTPDQDHGAVVLLPTPSRWLAVNHTIEIARAVRTLDPEREIRWLVTGKEDRWLDEHDLHHAGLAGSIRVVSEAAPNVLTAVAIIVRTGYGPSPSPLLTSASLAGVPVVGFSEQDVSPPLSATPPLDVEGLVTDLAAALLPGGIGRLGVEPGAGVEFNPRAVVDQLADWLDLPRPPPVG